MMEGLFLAVLLFTASAVQAGERQGANPASDNAITRDYYTQLIAAKPQRVAELTLFTNMLPKGADLHHHYSGAVYAEIYLDWVSSRNWCVQTQGDADHKFKVEKRAPDPDPKGPCLGGAGVRSDAAMFGELAQRWSDKDYGNDQERRLAPDRQFFATFGYFGTVADDYKAGLQWLKSRAKDENVGYLETMVTSSPTSELPEVASALAGVTTESSDPQVREAFEVAYAALDADQAKNNTVDAYVAMLEGVFQGLDDDSFKVRFQTYVSRNAPRAKVFSGLYTAFHAAARGPLRVGETNPIVGVNIVGPENGYVALNDYRLHMKMFAWFRQRFPGVHTSLHAGELVLGMVPPEQLRSHINDAVFVAGAERIGHGVDIVHELNAPEVLKTMRQNGIPVEINLTSNEFILGVKNEAHPLPLYARYGVPYVISTDDPGVSRNDLSSEYLLYVTRYKPSYDDLKRTSFDSIRYSFLPAPDKESEKKKLAARFAVFEAQIAALVRSGSKTGGSAVKHAGAEKP